MLSDRHSRLLSESLDRMLTPQEREELARLLEQEESARDLLSHLKKDARAIYEMPRLHLPEAFKNKVVELIERRRQQQETAAAVTAPSFPTWAGLAIAALVLGAVMLATFLYFRP